MTGGGSGIGRVLVHHFSSLSSDFLSGSGVECRYKVLTCGRRLSALEDTMNQAPCPERVTIVRADIAKAEDRQQVVDALPTNAHVCLLVQNAAVGDPSTDLASVDIGHLEYAFKVNVSGPLALVQLLLPFLKPKCEAATATAVRSRILHLGTSVAHRPQKGTLTYGVTKMAFHRLYQQLNAEGDVVCGSFSPGLVDTEGVRDHVHKARNCNLPHVEYFDRALGSRNESWVTEPDQLVTFVMELLSMDEALFESKEWRFSEWRANQGV